MNHDSRALHVRVRIRCNEPLNVAHKSASVRNLYLSEAMRMVLLQCVRVSTVLLSRPRVPLKLRLSDQLLNRALIIDRLGDHRESLMAALLSGAKLSASGAAGQPSPMKSKRHMTVASASSPRGAHPSTPKRGKKGAGRRAPTKRKGPDTKHEASSSAGPVKVKAKFGETQFCGVCGCSSKAIALQTMRLCVSLLGLLPRVLCEWFLVSQDNAWACTQDVEGPSGDLVPIPVGMACEECYSIGMDHLKYDRFAEFQTAHETSQETKALTSQIRSNIKNPGSHVDFDSSEVLRVVGTKVRVDTCWQAKTESELKKDLQAQRLSREQMNKIPSVTFPEDGMPATDLSGELFLFPRPGEEAPQRHLVVSTFLEMRGSMTRLCSRANTWRGHADSQLRSIVEDSFRSSGVKRGFTGFLTTYGAFKQAYREWQDQATNKRLSPGAASSALVKKAALQGKASSEFVVEDEKHVVEGIDVDLSSEQLKASSGKGLGPDAAQANDGDDVAQDGDADRESTLEDTAEAGEGVFPYALMSAHASDCVCVCRALQSRLAKCMRLLASSGAFVSTSLHALGSHSLCVGSGDWVATYRRRLPARSVMVGPCKGRSVKTHRERVTRLLKEQRHALASAALGPVLPSDQYMCCIAWCWRDAVVD